MKTHAFLALASLGWVALAASALATDSRHTAEYLLSSPLANQGKEISMDVALVEPVHWKSPLPEIAFFRAVTLDRLDRKVGGEILVAVPSANAPAFARKYGTDFRGRTESMPLKGLFTSVGGEGREPGVWMVDATDGLLSQAVSQKKLNLPADGGERKPGARLAALRNPGAN